MKGGMETIRLGLPKISPIVSTSSWKEKVSGPIASIMEFSSLLPFSTASAARSST